VEQDVEVLLGGHQVVGEPLGRPGRVHEDGRLLEGQRPESGAGRGEAVGHLAGQAPHHGGELARPVGAVQTADRPDGGDREVAAQEPVALAQHRRCAVAGRGHGRGETGRTAAGDHDVDVGQQRRLTPGDPHRRECRPIAGATGADHPKKRSRRRLPSEDLLRRIARDGNGREESATVAVATCCHHDVALLRSPPCRRRRLAGWTNRPASRACHARVERGPRSKEQAGPSTWERGAARRADRPLTCRRATRSPVPISARLGNGAASDAYASSRPSSTHPRTTRTS